MRWRDVHRAQQLVTGSGPAVEPLTYDDAKALLRLPSDVDLVLVDEYIKAAREKAEEDSGQYFITQKIDLFCDEFPDDPIVIPFVPLIAIDSIKVTSIAGVQSTVALSVYHVDTASIPARVHPYDGQYWPTDVRRMSGIVIRCSVGYGATGASVPGVARDAMRELVRMRYAARGTEVTPMLPGWLGYADSIRILRRRGTA